MRELDDFAGRWALERRIEDRRAGQVLRLEGRVTLAPTAGGLDVAEEGRLQLPDGTSLAAVRRYRWHRAGPVIAVDFDDGRPFHQFDPAVPRALAEHFCGADSYRVTYDFTAWPRWTVTWQVGGPRKNYVSESRLAFEGACTGTLPERRLA
ncbi:DUF6314 family protein [Roseitranquillus sediminis]|uniref:DUF6314 family protein n=1 Tax=Roseitranquillus sediminis TaxID=2809051 RepID=UPI001D0CBB4D|nr:DUF6314 family protein [Roseitranquillus sediminis]MBM9595233.1 hypothetical protein [Roseitranquillus sediminis]